MIGRAIFSLHGLQKHPTPQAPTRMAEHEKAISTPKVELWNVLTFSLSVPKSAVMIDP